MRLCDSVWGSHFPRVSLLLSHLLVSQLDVADTKETLWPFWDM